MKKLAELVMRAEAVVHEEEMRVLLAKLPEECAGLTPTVIRQGFIREVRVDNRSHCDVRVREEDGQRYTLTAKFHPKFQEATTEITSEIFNTLWPGVRGKQYKERYTLNNGWIVDDVKESRRGSFVVAEYEMKKGQPRVEVPETFQVRRGH